MVLTCVMVLTRVMVLSCFMMLARVMVLASFIVLVRVMSQTFQRSPLLGSHGLSVRRVQSQESGPGGP